MEFIDFLKSESSFFASVLLFLVLCVIGINAASSKACDINAASFSNYDHHFFGGCMVEHNGRWVPLKNVRFEGDKVIYEYR